MSAAERPRIAVVGAGAIGGWIGGRLALAGEHVSLVARGETLAALRTRGLELEEGGSVRTAAVEAVGDASLLGPQDVLIIAVKAPHLAPAARAAEPLIGPRTSIVPMLNGVPWWFMPGEPLASVDPGGAIAAALPAEQVLGCVVHAACARSSPNRIAVKHADKLILGEPRGGTGARVSEVARLFAGVGVQVEETPDIRRAIWYKLWGNATINPLSALTRATADRLLADPHLRSFMLEAMAELALVGAAVGCAIEESGEDRMAVTTRLGAFKPSMLQDVEAGRAIELEALLGAPREIAQRVHVATPALDRIYAMTSLLAANLGLD